MNAILIVTVLFILTQYSYADVERVVDDIDSRDFYSNCVNAIHRKCQHRHEFSDTELAQALKWLQDRYIKIGQQRPEWAPVREKCRKLEVNKDFKCLTHGERMELMDAMRILYKQGVNEQLAIWPHGAYWGSTHKSADAAMSHRYQMAMFTKAMKKINPRLTLPYFNPHEEYNQMELSILWDYIGHAGTKESDYCVLDGAFTEAPKPCLKRQWVNDTYMVDISNNESYDVLLQTSKKLTDTGTWSLSTHFTAHLAIGGRNGHMSAPNGPYDNVFQMFHIMFELWYFNWQLQDDTYLMPVSYDGLNIYDWEIDGARPANLATDTLIVFGVPAKEGFQFGFGELCILPDVIIDNILDAINGRRKPMPKKYQNMDRALLEKYYPKFASGNWTSFDFLSHDIPQCNRRCIPMPKSQRYEDTYEGNVLLDRFKYWNRMNVKGSVIQLEGIMDQFIDDMNAGGYCSPYLIS